MEWAGYLGEVNEKALGIFYFMMIDHTYYFAWHLPPL